MARQRIDIDKTNKFTKKVEIFFVALFFFFNLREIFFSYCILLMVDMSSEFSEELE